MVEEHHRFNGYELGQALRDREGQGGLVCCSPWGHKQLGHNLSIEQQTTSCLRKGKAEIPVSMESLPLGLTLEM